VAVLTVLYSVEADDRSVANHGRAVRYASRHSDPIAGTKDVTCAVDDELELAGDDGIDLVDAVRVFREVRAWRLDVTTDRIAVGFESLAQCFLGQFTVTRRIPAMDAHASEPTYVPQISCSLASRPQLHR